MPQVATLAETSRAQILEEYVQARNDVDRIHRALSHLENRARKLHGMLHTAQEIEASARKAILNF